MLSNQIIKNITSQISLVSDLSDDVLIEFCAIANQRYRIGSPIISDEDYDFIFLHELAKNSCNMPHVICLM